MKRSSISKFMFVFAFLFYFKCTGEQTQAREPEKQPEVTWKLQLPGPIVASPVVAGDIVFVGCEDSTLYAISNAKGSIIWKVRTGGQIRSAVALDKKRLYLLSGDGNLYCLDQATGKLVWVFHSFNGYMGDRKNDFADYYYSSPVLRDSMLFFGSGDCVYALKSANGEVVWTFRTGDVVHTTPAFYKDKLFIGSFDGKLYALNSITGNLVWSFKTVGHRFFPKGEVMGNPIVGKGLVIVGARDFNLYAIDIYGGYCHWMKQFPRGWALPLTMNDSVVYAGTSDDRQLFAFDIATGRELWKMNAGFNLFGACALDRNTGYFGTLAGKVFSFDIGTGTIKWTFAGNGYTANHSLYLGQDDAYREDIGSIIRSSDDMIAMYYKLGGIFSTPVITKDNLIITCFDGMIYCIRR